MRPGHWTLRIIDGHLPQNYYLDKDVCELDVQPGQSIEETFKALPRRRRIQIIAQGKTLETSLEKGKAVAEREKERKVEVPLPKQKPAEVPPPTEKIAVKVPAFEVVKPVVVPQTPSKAERVECTVLFRPQRLVFVIEHSRWPTRASAKWVAERLAKRTKLPVRVMRGVSQAGRASFSVVVGAFKSRKAAEDACAQVRELH
jgi:hypothetical protein